MRNHIINLKLLVEDDRALAALAQIGGYQPNNPTATVENLQRLQTEMIKARDAKTAAEAAHKAASDQANDTARAYHEAILLAKVQVKGQFGPDSAEVQSIGLKRSSERKRPVAAKKAKT